MGQSESEFRDYARDVLIKTATGDATEGDT
jgi:hypothetical protein